MRGLFIHKLSKDRLVQIENKLIEAYNVHKSIAHEKLYSYVDGERVDYGYKQVSNGFSWVNLTGTFIEFSDDEYLYVSGKKEYIYKYLAQHLTPEEISELIPVKKEVQDIPIQMVKQSA